MKKITCIAALCAASFSFAQIVTDGSFESIADANNTNKTTIAQGNKSTANGVWYSNGFYETNIKLETQNVSAGNSAIIFDNGNSKSAKLHQNITLSPNTTYTFSAKARLVSATNDVDSPAAGTGERFVAKIVGDNADDKAVVNKVNTTTAEIDQSACKVAARWLSHTEFRPIAFEFTTDNKSAWTLEIVLQGSYDTFVILDEVSITEGTLSKTDLSKFNFSYAPNPANNVINLNAAKTISKVEFYNTLGQNVLSNNIEALNSTINIQSLNKGIYVMHVTIDGLTQGFKILKQ